MTPHTSFVFNVGDGEMAQFIRAHKNSADVSACYKTTLISKLNDSLKRALGVPLMTLVMTLRREN